MCDTETILVADDDENDLVLLQRACQQAKLPNPLQFVRNGEEVICYLKGSRQFADRGKYPFPSVLLLDLNMPRKSGFEVLAWLRGEPDLRRLPVFVLTSSMRVTDVEQAYDLGTNGFLVKPTDMKDLHRMMTCLRDWLHCNEFPLVKH